MNGKATAESSSRQSIENFIFQHPFPKGMNHHQLQMLADCAMQAHFAPNEVVFKTGDPANRFYLIQRGSVALEAPVDGQKRLIQTIGPGDVPGWSWLFPRIFGSSMPVRWSPLTPFSFMAQDLEKHANPTMISVMNFSGAWPM